MTDTERLDWLDKQRDYGMDCLAFRLPILVGWSIRNAIDYEMRRESEAESKREAE